MSADREQRIAGRARYLAQVVAVASTRERELAAARLNAIRAPMLRTGTIAAARRCAS